MFSVFLLCSGLAAAVNILTGNVLYGVLGMDGPVTYPLAVSMAFVAGMVVSFTFNRRFTYASSGRPVFHELRDFAGVSVGGLLLTTGLAFLLREFSSPALAAATAGRVPAESAAHIIAVGLTAFYSFFAHKLISFRHVDSLPFAGRALARIDIALPALVGLTLLTRPFRGVADVGLLYAGEALQTAGLARLGDDPFFAYGNQGSFSVFNWIYAALIRLAGIDGAAFTLWAAAMILWVSGLWRLVARLEPSATTRLMMAAAALLLFPGYGPMNISYGENLAIPRVFGEALGLHALALVLGGRVWLSALLLVAAAALHPIMAMVSGAVWLHLWVRRTWLFVTICLGGLIAGVALGLAGVTPFTWLLQSYDSDWLSLIHFTNMLVFPLTWEAAAPLGLIFPLTMMALALRRGGEPARLARSVLVAAVALVAVTILGADLMANRLISALQPWRVLFLVSLLGNILWAQKLGKQDWTRPAAWLLAIAGLLSAVEAAFRLIPLISAAVTVLFLLALWARGLLARRRWIGPALIGLALALGAGLVGGAWMRATGTGLAPVLVIGLSGLVVAAIAQSAGRGRKATPLVLVALAGAGAMADARSAPERLATVLTTQEPQLAEALTGQDVYWEGGLGYLWLGLHQPSFHSCTQTSGIAFFREQAFETRRRAEALRALNTADFYPNPGGRCLQKAEPELSAPANPGVLAAVCDRLSELDVIILRQPPASTPGNAQTLHVPAPSVLGRLRSVGAPSADSAWLYRCKP